MLLRAVLSSGLDLDLTSQPVKHLLWHFYFNGRLPEETQNPSAAELARSTMICPLGPTRPPLWFLLSLRALK